MMKNVADDEEAWLNKTIKLSIKTTWFLSDDAIAISIGYGLFRTEKLCIITSSTTTKSHLDDRKRSVSGQQIT